MVKEIGVRHSLGKPWLRLRILDFLFNKVGNAVDAAWRNASCATATMWGCSFLAAVKPQAS